MKQYKQLVILFLLLFPYLAKGQSDVNSLFEEKSKLFITQLVDSFDLPPAKIDDVYKYYWPYVIARLEKYGVEDLDANRFIEAFNIDLPRHFGLVGAARLVYLYPNCSAVRNNLQVLVKSVFDRNDSYNAWTGEGSEYQVSISRTSGYLFAQKALIFGGFFEDAPSRLADMKTWILDWSSRIYEVGSGEFNSGITGAYNLLGWLNLYDFAEDEEVRLAARAVLDYYATEMALHNSFGLTGGAEMRGISHKGSEQTATYFYNWLWFSKTAGVHFQGNEYIQLIYGATSSYQPPEILINYVQTKPEFPQWYLKSNPDYLLGKASVNKQFYYRTANFTIGSQVSNYGGWTANSSEIINWKLVVNNKDTISEVRGNGSYWNNYNGTGRDPWTQWAQDRNILIQLTKVPSGALDLYKEIHEMCESWNLKWKKDFKRRFKGDKNRKNIYEEAKHLLIENNSYLSFPNYLKITQKNKVWFVNFGTVYLAIVGIPTYQSMSIESVQDQSMLIMTNDPGKICGFVMEVVNASDFIDFENFQNRFVREHIMYIDLETQLLSYDSMDGRHIEMLYQDEGVFFEPIVDWGYGVQQRQVHQHLTSFKQPEWPVKTGTGRTPLFLANGHRYDFNMVWPVLSGPAIQLDQSILKINFNGDHYQVNYQKRIPEFSNN